VSLDARFKAPPEAYLTSDALHVLSLLDSGELAIWWDQQRSDWSTGDDLFAITPALRGHLDLFLLDGLIAPQGANQLMQKVELTAAGQEAIRI
jgi:hypothetical protein